MSNQYLWFVYLQIADLENLKLLIYSFKNYLFQITMSQIGSDDDGDGASVDKDS